MGTSLFARSAPGLVAKYLTGTMQGEDKRKAEERQNQMDAFAEYARRRQLALQQEQMGNLDEYRQGQLRNAETTNDIRRALGEQGNEIKRVANELGTWRDRAMLGPEGTVLKGQQNQKDIATDRNAAGITEAQIRAAAVLAAAASRAGASANKPPKPPTEGESKDYLYYTNIKRGNEGMEAVRDKIRPGVVTSYLTSRFFKPALTTEEQLFVRGARDYAAGVLRKETGATVRDDELRDVFSRYIDSGLDAPEAREAKRAARQGIEQTFAKMSNRAQQFYDNGEAGPGGGGVDEETATWLKKHRAGRKP